MRATSESKEWIFLATSLGLELLSAACDQASSPRRPHFALFGLLLAIAAVLISIGELIDKGKKESVVFRKGWFYHRHPPSKPFGTLPDIFGLVAGISQCICSMVQYVYCLRHADNPVKVSLLPAIFLVCLGASKLTNNRMNANTTNNNDSRENSSSTVEMHATASRDDHEVEGNIEQERRWRRQEEEEEQQQEWRQQKELWRRQKELQEEEEQHERHWLHEQKQEQTQMQKQKQMQKQWLKQWQDERKQKWQTQMQMLDEWMLKED